MVILIKNIYQFKLFICFLVDEIDSMIWIEKKNLIFEMKSLSKNEMWMQKKFNKVDIRNGKNKILHVFFKSCNDILKSWDEVMNLCVEILNMCTEFLNICDERHVFISSNNYMKYGIIY